MSVHFTKSDQDTSIFAKFAWMTSGLSVTNQTAGCGLNQDTRARRRASGAAFTSRGTSSDASRDAGGGLGPGVLLSASSLSSLCQRVDFVLVCVWTVLQARG